MMNDYMALALLALGGFLISQAVYYGCCTYLREIKFKQELFRIRNELWRNAYRVDGLEDSAYLLQRDALNATIRIASHLNVASMALISFSHTDSNPDREFARSANPKLSEAVEKADRERRQAIGEYVLKMKMSGRLARLFAACYWSWRSTNRWVVAIIRLVRDRTRAIRTEDILKVDRWDGELTNAR